MTWQVGMQERLAIRWVYQWLPKSTPIQQKSSELLNVSNIFMYKHAFKMHSCLFLPVLIWNMCFSYNFSLFCFLDFTALLVDIIGNSTSYLTEIFKSTSILSGLHFFFSIYCCLQPAQYFWQFTNSYTQMMVWILQYKKMYIAEIFCKYKCFHLRVSCSSSISEFVRVCFIESPSSHFCHALLNT